MIIHNIIAIVDIWWYIYIYIHMYQPLSWLAYLFFLFSCLALLPLSSLFFLGQLHTACFLLLSFQYHDCRDESRYPYDIPNADNHPNIPIHIGRYTVHRGRNIWWFLKHGSPSHWCQDGRLQGFLSRESLLTLVAKKPFTEPSSRRRGYDSDAMLGKKEK